MKIRPERVLGFTLLGAGIIVAGIMAATLLEKYNNVTSGRITTGIIASVEEGGSIRSRPAPPLANIEFEVNGKTCSFHSGDISRQLKAYDTVKVIYDKNTHCPGYSHSAGIYDPPGFFIRPASIFVVAVIVSVIGYIMTAASIKKR